MPCEECKMLSRVELIEEKTKEHEIRLNNLEDFKRWAKPIIDAIDTIHTNIKWMTIVAVLFAAVCGFIYTKEIKPFLQQYNVDKSKMEEKQHLNQLEVVKQIESLKTEIVKASKINYRATVKKIKEYSNKE